jgi:hypothetical protein
MWNWTYWLENCNQLIAIDLSSKYDLYAVACDVIKNVILILFGSRE